MMRLQPRLPPAYRLIAFDSIGSTNDEAKRLARSGAAAGTVIWALEQTAGRGRRGHGWVSARGNFYASLILRPDCPANDACQLGFVAALAIGGALAAMSPALSVSYKWPNDVLISGRKVAGILLESEMVWRERPSFVVIGVGVNLSASPKGTEFPATSMVAEGSGAVSPEGMLEQFVEHFQSWLATWRAKGFAPIRAAWLAAASITRGEPLRVRLDAQALCGRFLDIDHDGNLLLDRAGECRRIASGEVFPAA
jgi:BirA family biotin operon repressor/biotin-[acetyl-CoA-carboxylase] ligase